MYSLGDKIVHPLHGAGVIEDIVQKTVNEKTLDYYILKLPSSNMTLMVPVETSETIGLRDVISPERADELIKLASEIEIIETHNWNRRYRENISKLKSGDLDEVITVIKSLTYREKKNGLSTGERKMLHSAKHILISELVLAKNKTFKEIEEELNQAMSETK